MSFYFRKSVRLGPFRLNFSKSGIGVSAGIPGLRVGTGPRGTYIHAGRNGVYYRKTFSWNSRTTSTATSTATGTATSPRHPSHAPPVAPAISATALCEIESADIEQLQDSSSAELLAELERKHTTFRLWPIIAGLAIILLWAMRRAGFADSVFIAALLILATMTVLAYTYDQLAKTVVLFYKLDDDAQRAYQEFHDAFASLMHCARAWHVAATGPVGGGQAWKREAGANALVKRSPIQLTCAAPPFLKTNLLIPQIPVGRQTLYFLPDRMLVYERGRVGVVSYTELQVQVRNTRFVEAGEVPPDTVIEDHTWEHLNTSGGPDRRYRNNRQLPIVIYQEIHFTSPSGLNELIQVSKPDAALSLPACLRRIAMLQPGADEPLPPAPARRRQPALPRPAAPQPEAAAPSSAASVDRDERRLTRLISLHREGGDAWNWNAVLRAELPGLPEYRGDVAAYQAERAALEAARDLARRVLARDASVYHEIVTHSSLSRTLGEAGRSLELAPAAGGAVAVTLRLHKAEEIMPDEAMSLSDTGDLRSTPLSKTHCYNLYRDYVCSAILRVGRELFAALPIEALVVTRPGRGLESRHRRPRGSCGRVSRVSACDLS
jgi:hypothetical protein